MMASNPDQTSLEKPLEPKSGKTGTQDNPPAATVLWLVRHAEVEERYHNVFGGRIDMELSPRGHQQAGALARYFQNQKIDAVFASPMKRVQQTLAALLAAGAPQPTVHQELREVDFGDWTGLHWDEVQAKFGVSAFAWLDQLERAAITNGECARSLRARVEPCLREILQQQAGKHVALVCHGGVIRVILSILLELPLPKAAVFEIDYASATKVLWTPPLVRLQLVNFAPWRELTE